MTGWMPPIRIEPYPSESLGGFLIRFCEINGWPSLNHFAKLLGVGVRDARFQLGDLSAIETKLGLPSGTLPWEGSRQGARDVMLGGQALRFVHFHGERRVCRTCLAENGYARSYWDLRFISHCHLHLEPLDHRCGCGSDLTWLDPSLAQCRTCLNEGVPVPQSGQAGPRWPFQEWCLVRLDASQADGSVPVLDALPLATALRMVENIGRLVVGGYVYSQASEMPVSMFEVREAGFAVVRDGMIEELVARIVRDFRKVTGIVCPDPAHGALGWFGTVLSYEAGGAPDELVSRLLTALSLALGYPVSDLDRACYVTVAQVAAVERVTRAAVLNGINRLGLAGACLQVEGQDVIPETAVYPIREIIRRRYGVAPLRR